VDIQQMTNKSEILKIKTKSLLFEIQVFELEVYGIFLFVNFCLLEFVSWNLEFVTWNLDFGIWILKNPIAIIFSENPGHLPDF